MPTLFDTNSKIRKEEAAKFNAAFNTLRPDAASKETAEITLKDFWDRTFKLCEETNTYYDPKSRNFYEIFSDSRINFTELEKIDPNLQNIYFTSWLITKHKIKEICFGDARTPLYTDPAKMTNITEAQKDIIIDAIATLQAATSTHTLAMQC